MQARGRRTGGDLRTRAASNSCHTAGREISALQRAVNVLACMPSRLTARTCTGSCRCRRPGPGRGQTATSPAAGAGRSSSPPAATACRQKPTWEVTAGGADGLVSSSTARVVNARCIRGSETCHRARTSRPASLCAGCGAGTSPSRQCSRGCLGLQNMWGRRNRAAVLHSRRA